MSGVYRPSTNDSSELCLFEVFWLLLFSFMIWGFILESPFLGISIGNSRVYNWLICEFNDNSFNISALDGV